jgi:hypothetical protein
MASPPPTTLVRHRRHISIFCSAQNAQLFAFTRDATGLNLPREYGPWQHSNDPAMQGVVSGDEGRVSDAVLLSIDARGFYLSRSDGNAW